MAVGSWPSSSFGGWRLEICCLVLERHFLGYVIHSGYADEKLNGDIDERQLLTKRKLLDFEPDICFQRICKL